MGDALEPSARISVGFGAVELAAVRKKSRRLALCYAMKSMAGSNLGLIVVGYDMACRKTVVEGHGQGAARWVATEGLDGFEIVAELGRGGIGAVYRARDKATQSAVALKVLELSTDTTRSLFDREYQTLTFLQHPSVPQVYHFGVSRGGCRYYTMELVEGVDLYHLAPVDWRAVCAYVRDIASVLGCLHARGWLHRDISPRNIRVGSDGRAKLLDFGALSPFGLASQLVGTPACGAPECLRRLPLGPRSDLFSLGATAYMALTRRRPFRIKRWRDGEQAWQVTPQSPSDLVPEIPKALSELILSLLSIDPHARPPSAADVIERLERIGGLPEENGAPVVRAPLVSPVMVGRDREWAQLTHELRQVQEGKGGVLALQGLPGMGRSRLAQEFAVAAQVAGATVVQVQGTGSGRAGEGLALVLRALLAASPAEAAALRPADPFLDALLDDARFGADSGLLDSAGDAAAAAPDVANGDFGSEVVATGLAALGDWLAEVATTRPLILIVDDLEQFDSLSIRALLSLLRLAAVRPILLLLTLLDGGGGLLGSHFFQRQLTRVSLGPLSQDALVALVGTVFGEVDHRFRLAQWLHGVADGNPGHALAALNALVARGTIRWLGSSFALPKNFHGLGLPTDLEAVLEARLAGLGDDCLALARGLALYGSAAPIPLCKRLVPKRARPQAQVLMAELIARQVVVVAGDSYRVRADLQKALLAPLSGSQVRSLHQVVGRGLEAGLGQISPASLHKPSKKGAAGGTVLRKATVFGPTAFVDCSTQELVLHLRAGWHALQGGARRRGSARMRSAAVELSRRASGLIDAVPALEAALAVHPGGGRARLERKYWLAPLVLAGLYLDHRLTYRYYEEALDTLATVAGIKVMVKCARVVPGRLAVLGGFTWAFASWLFSPSRVRALEFHETVSAFVGVAAATLGSFATMADAPRARKVIALLQPMGWLPETHTLAKLYQFQLALVESAEGHYGVAERRCRKVWRALEDASPGFREQVELGVCGLMGAIQCYRTDGRVFETLAVLDKMGTSLAREQAAGIRANYHASRGEMEQSTWHREQVDAFVLGGASPWKQDFVVPRCLWWVAIQCEDALALRRTVRQLDALAQECKAYVPLYAAAHANYCADRGGAEDALAAYQGVLEAAMQRVTVFELRVVAAYARLLRLAGQAEEARALCETRLAQLGDEDRALTCLVFGVEYERVRALLASGWVTQASEAADKLLRAQAGHDNPLLHVLAHSLRARVAVAQQNQAVFAAHWQQAESWCQRAESAALYAQLRQLLSEGLEAGLSCELSGLSAGASTEDLIRRAMADCRASSERFQVLLDVLVEASRAVGGQLFLVGGQGPRLIAPALAQEPPAALLEELRKRWRDWVGDSEVETDVLLTTKVGRECAADPVARVGVRLDAYYRVLLLTGERRGEVRLLAMVTLAQGTCPLQSIPAGVLEAVSKHLLSTPN